MRLVIQRVTYAQVRVGEQIIGKIGTGFLVLVGIEQTDTKEIADKLLKKMLNLRIFPDENGKTNRSLREVNGSVLLVSQFTLYADCRKGNRPSFVHAGEPGQAEELYEYMLKCCRDSGIPTQQGEFGADMKVELLNDGPFTILLDSRDLC